MIGRIAIIITAAFSIAGLAAFAFENNNIAFCIGGITLGGGILLIVLKPKWYIFDPKQLPPKVKAIFVGVGIVITAFSLIFLGFIIAKMKEKKTEPKPIPIDSGIPPDPVKEKDMLYDKPQLIKKKDLVTDVTVHDKRIDIVDVSDIPVHDKKTDIVDTVPTGHDIKLAYPSLNDSNWKKTREKIEKISKLPQRSARTFQTLIISIDQLINNSKSSGLPPRELTCHYIQALHEGWYRRNLFNEGIGHLNNRVNEQTNKLKELLLPKDRITNGTTDGFHCYK